MKDQLGVVGMDFIFLIFVLSAIDPDHLTGISAKIFEACAPGGFVFFRDYAEDDLKQKELSKKEHRALNTNFLVRGDGTRTFFFETHFLETVFRGAGFEVKSMAGITD